MGSCYTEKVELPRCMLDALNIDERIEALRHEVLHVIQYRRQVLPMHVEASRTPMDQRYYDKYYDELRESIDRIDRCCGIEAPKAKRAVGDSQQEFDAGNYDKAAGLLANANFEILVSILGAADLR